MINLEPIAKSVQKRLFEKMRALGRETSYSDSPTDGLTQQEMMSRTTFIRMSSNQENPVILMGGEILPNTPTTDSEGNVTIINNGKLAGGYDDLYSSRGYMDNPNKRPLPGIKSIDVSFKGGARAQREATINWTCWSFEDIDRLTPHFLAHGKTVLLDWGWIYNKSSLLKLQNLMSNGGLTKSAFEDYSEEIKKGGGDFDSIVGIIKNFEYTTRSDGAFDCQTIIGSLGVSIIDNTIPNQQLMDGGKKINIETLTKTKEGREKLKKVYESLENDEESIVTLNASISLNAFMKHLDLYLKDQIKSKYEKNIRVTSEYGGGVEVADVGMPSNVRSAKSGGAICAVENKFIVYGKWRESNKGKIEFDPGSKFFQSYVRWGWFEDNVLSKFTSITSDTNILSRFRSIDGDKSIKIRNSKYLETIDFGKYILPGQTFPIKKGTTLELLGDEYELDGDDDILIKLTESVNYNFNPFFVEGDAVILTEEPYEAPDFGPNGEVVKVNSKGQAYYKPRVDADDSNQFGYLRNMLINTRVLQNIFEDVIGIAEAMNKLFDELNQPLPYWSFELETDPDLPNQIRIVDTQRTSIDFNKPLQPQRSVYSNNQLLNNGIFFFPVWRHDSIVKSQNISAKVPTAMQLSTMYGSNLKAIKYPSGPGFNGSTEGVTLGALLSEFEDRNNSGFDQAFRNALEIGNKDGFASQPLEVNGGKDDGVFEFLKKYDDTITKSLEDKNDDKESALAPVLEVKYDKLPYDASKPIPPLNRLGNTDLDKLLNNADADDRELFLKTIGSKYKKYKMKPKTKSSIETLTAEHYGGTSDYEQSVLIPLEMELEIDGTGGIYPGNSYHSTYLPQVYQDKTVFQIFDVNHTVSSTGWTTSISGKMRTSYSQVIDYLESDDVLKDLIDNYRSGIENKANEEKARDKAIDDLLPESDPEFGNRNTLYGGSQTTTFNYDQPEILSNEMEIRGGAGGTKQKWGYIVRQDKDGKLINE